MLDNILPKEITKDKDTGFQVASFGYYEGIRFAKEVGLEFGTDIRKVLEGTHYLVCCGDVMLKVKETDFPKIERREI